MSLSIDDLTTPLTVDEIRQSIYSVLALTGVSTTDWKPGAVVRTIISGVAVVLSALSALVSLSARAGFLALSTGDWLTLVAHYLYGVDRILATAATGTVTLANSSGGVYTVSAGDLIVKSSLTGKRYSNVAGFTLNALSSLDVTVSAIELGSGSTAFSGEIDTLETTLTGVTVTNTLALIGTDDEEDSALRLRCSEKLGSLSPGGPTDAYNFAARSATRADGSNVGVTRVRTTKDTAGNVDIYVANATGGITGTTLSGDLHYVDDAIQKNAAPLGITARTHAATSVVLDVTYEIWRYTDGLSETDIATKISAALAAFVSSQPIGGNVADVLPGKIYLDAIETVIWTAVPNVFKISVTAPAGDTALGPSDVPVLGLILVTDIHNLPNPG